MKDIHFVSIFSLLVLMACNDECRVVKQAYADATDKVVFIYPDCHDTTYYKRQYFYENGQLASEGYYRNGEREGKFRSWAKNGNQTAEWEVLDGKENGFVQCWHSNGVKKRESTLDKGIENGHFKEWFEDGKIACEGDYLTGRKIGKWQYWEENGSWTITNYKNDTLEGYTLEHHLVDSGRTQLVSGQFEKGKEVGLWKWFTEDSTLYKTAIYKDGILNGEVIEYYASGKIKSRGKQINGRYIDEVAYYDENGRLTATRQEKGKRIF